jgi:site-specific recombinase XerD
MYDQDSPRILKDFLGYHETIKGQSSKTISEYYLDLRMFLRVMKLFMNDQPLETDLDTVSIRDVDIAFLKQIKLEHIYDFMTYLVRYRHDSAAARARKLSAIKSFYKYLTVRTKQLDENPVADVEYPKLRRALPKYLTLEQAQALLSSVEGTHADRDYAILMIFLNCGVRISELAGLNYGDIYQDRLRVLGKGNKERTVYMGDAVVDSIMEYNQTLPEPLQNDPKRPLFLSQKGGRMSTNAIHRLVKKHLAAAGLDATQYSAHKLRHTAATLMLSQGVDVKTVQEVLGHEHLNTTEIYTHIENTELKIAAEANPLSDFTPKK